MTRLQTGLRALDKHLDGGLPPGALALLTYNTTTQAETILHTIVEANAGSVGYVTTTTTVDGAVAEFRKSHIDIDIDSVEFGSCGAVTSTTTLSLRETIMAMVEEGDDDRNGLSVLVIDTLTDLERNISRQSYQQFVSWLQRYQRANSVTVVGTRYSEYTTGAESEYITNRSTDIKINTEYKREDDQAKIYLHVPQCRFAEPYENPMGILLDTEVRVDTSRDI